jgi:hypothetical protein
MAHRPGFTGAPTVQGFAIQAVSRHAMNGGGSAPVPGADDRSRRYRASPFRILQSSSDDDELSRKRAVILERRRRTRQQDEFDVNQIESDDDDWDEDDDLEDDDEDHDLFGNYIIPNPLLDSIDPDGAADRFPELARDPRFWIDMALFVAFLNFLSSVGPRDTLPDIPWY